MPARANDGDDTHDCASTGFATTRSRSLLPLPRGGDVPVAAGLGCPAPPPAPTRARRGLDRLRGIFGPAGDVSDGDDADDGMRNVDGAGGTIDDDAANAGSDDGCARTLRSCFRSPGNGSAMASWNVNPSSMPKLRSPADPGTLMGLTSPTAAAAAAPAPKNMSDTSGRAGRCIASAVSGDTGRICAADAATRDTLECSAAMYM